LQYDPIMMNRRILSLVVLLCVPPAFGAEATAPQVLWQFESGG